MTRFVLTSQLLFFLLYGFASAGAFSFVLEHHVRQATSDTLADVFVAMPITSLAEQPL